MNLKGRIGVETRGLGGHCGCWVEFRGSGSKHLLHLWVTASSPGDDNQSPRINSPQCWEKAERTVQLIPEDCPPERSAWHSPPSPWGVCQLLPRTQARLLADDGVQRINAFNFYEVQLISPAARLTTLTSEFCLHRNIFSHRFTLSLFVW